jgi:hypothetical protein
MWGARAELFRFARSVVCVLAPIGAAVNAPFARPTNLWREQLFVDKRMARESRHAVRVPSISEREPPQRRRPQAQFITGWRLMVSGGRSAN